MVRAATDLRRVTERHRKEWKGKKVLGTRDSSDMNGAQKVSLAVVVGEIPSIDYVFVSFRPP